MSCVQIRICFYESIKSARLLDRRRSANKLRSLYFASFSVSSIPKKIDLLACLNNQYLKVIPLSI